MRTFFCGVNTYGLGGLRSDILGQCDRHVGVKLLQGNWMSALHALNALDFSVSTFFNGFARRSWAFDESVAFLSANDLFKGGFLMVLLWWAWFRRGSQALADAARDHVIATLASCVAALAVARLMILLLPYRERPLHTEALDWTLPHGVAVAALDGLSSFPSDHATLFFALAVGLVFVSRRLGLLAFAYVTIAIALPRLYLGLHFLSDLVVGGLIGGATSAAGNRLLVGGRLTRRVRGWSDSAPQFFYPALFLVTYQIAELFGNSRALVSGLVKLGKALFGL
jgi:undecaprenyl-diphosphatase